jgi:hypothetical protein
MARLYPAGWRERYAAELDALIEDIKPKWQDLFNVLLGALRMQMKTSNYLRIGAAAGLVGGLLAGVIAFRTHEGYISQAVIRITPVGQANIDRQALDRFIRQMKQEILSRRSLGEMITRPALNLYPEDRERMPLEDVVENMRRAVSIKLVEVPSERGAAFEFSYLYPDKFKAQSVANELTARLIEQNLTIQENQAASAPMIFRLLEPPSLPKRPVGPNRTTIVTEGLLGGAVLGLLAVLVRQSAVRLSKSA